MCGNLCIDCWRTEDESQQRRKSNDLRPVETTVHKMCTKENKENHYELDLLDQHVYCDDNSSVWNGYSLGVDRVLRVVRFGHLRRRKRQQERKIDESI